MGLLGNLNTAQIVEQVEKGSEWCLGMCACMLLNTAFCPMRCMYAELLPTAAMHGCMHCCHALLPCTAAVHPSHACMTGISIAMHVQLPIGLLVRYEAALVRRRTAMHPMYACMLGMCCMRMC